MTWNFTRWFRYLRKAGFSRVEAVFYAVFPGAMFRSSTKSPPPN